jgi:hypothetical protein
MYVPKKSLQSTVFASCEASCCGGGHEIEPAINDTSRHILITYLNRLASMKLHFH